MIIIGNGVYVPDYRKDYERGCYWHWMLFGHCGNHLSSLKTDLDRHACWMALAASVSDDSCQSSQALVHRQETVQYPLIEAWLGQRS